MNKVKIVREDRSLPMPRRVHEDDAGSDLIALETDFILPMETKVIKTNSRMAIPAGYFGRVCGRSGLASQGLLVHPGAVDAGYTGNIGVIATNLSTDNFPIAPGDRIAQIIILPVYVYEFEEVPELPSSARGNKGFGSSGV